MSTPGSVLVLGAGVIGLSVAWRAARAGASVTVLDPDPARGASWVAGGMLAPAAEAHHGEDRVAALGTISRDMYPRFVDELAADSGRQVGYTTRGTLVVARDAGELAELERLSLLHDELGLTAERVSSREARRIEPALAPGVRGGLWLPEDHQVDNRLLLAALTAACVARGVTFERLRVARVSSTGVETEPGEATRVQTRRADHVVVATGSELPAIEVDDVEVALPVRPVKGQVLRLRVHGPAVYPTRTVRSIGIYVIPRDHGEIAVGATSEDRGHDRTVTVGGVLQLLRDAWELVPGISEAELVEATAGSRPATPDHVPIVGRLGADGPVVATGHHRNGVLLAPLTAEMVVGLLHGRQPTGVGVDHAAWCSPDRFAATRQPA